mmetsp:Transcript_15685/g.20645  ORF Transcript_15685/g.20645 Transcript_15685/m.20645 type:complete len:159 (+) Transcript_15685:1-477(+)
MEAQTYTEGIRDARQVVIRDLVGRTLYLGKVSGSLYLENLEKCTIFVACRQIRVHNSSDTSIYLFVLSKPVIEDCKNIRFGSLNDFEGREKFLISCGIEEKTEQNKEAQLEENSHCTLSLNKWDQVLDFNSPSGMSPNWHKLEAHTTYVDFSLSKQLA